MSLFPTLAVTPVVKETNVIINLGGPAGPAPKPPNSDKVISDTGWKTVAVGRCYHKETREVSFNESATDDEIKAFAAFVKAKMYGQVAVVTIQGLTASFIHAVDSGD